MKYYLLNMNLTPSSVKNYLYWINVYLKHANNRLSHRTTLDFKDFCQHRYAVATQRLIFTSVNCYLAYRKVSYRLEVPRLNFTFKRDIISEATYHLLLENAVFEDPFVSMRNRNMLIVLWQTGLRISELINLKWSDIGTIYLCVTSKNNRTRFIPYYHKLFDELKTIQNSSYVFATRGGKKLAYASIYKMFKKLGNANFSPHAMRHSFATRLLQRGVPINYVSNLLGHSSVDTTLIYLHYKNEDIIRELEAKDWPQGKS